MPSRKQIKRKEPSRFKDLDRGMTRKIVMWSLGGIFLLFVICLSGYELSKMILGPKIEINDLEKTFSVENSPSITLTGNIRNSILTTLNGRPIYIDTKGNFKETVLLSLGINRIELFAEDKFGKEEKEIVEIFRK